MQSQKKRVQKRVDRKEKKMEKALGFAPYVIGPTFPSQYGCRIVSVGYSASAGATSSTYEYLAVNSLLASTSTVTTTPQYNANVTNLGKTYAAYRVTKYKITFESYSRAAKNCWLIVGNMPEDPAPGTGSSIDFKLASYPRSQFLLVPSTTTITPNKVGPFVHQHLIRSVVSSDEALTDDNYSGTINSSGVFSAPAKLVYWFLTSSAYSGAFTAGESPLTKFVLEQWVEFFDRRN